jgi:hypothetical protein
VAERPLVPSRRRVLGATLGLTGVAGCSALGERGNVQFANQTDRELLVDLTIRRTGDWLRESRVAYHERVRLFPTTHTRATLVDVVRPGEYDVTLRFDSRVPENSRGPHETRWRPDGEPGESLVVSVAPDFAVEFATQS